MKRVMTTLTVMAFIITSFMTQAFAQEDSLDMIEEDNSQPSATDMEEATKVQEETMIADTEFLQALQNRGGQQYVVVPGDTLWDICERILGSPWYWQKVWGMNPQIANAHWIEPGNIIYFQSAGDMGSLVAMQDLSMQGEAATEEDLSGFDEIIDTEAWGQVKEGGKFRLEKYLTKIKSSAFSFFNFRRDGFIAKSELRNTGKIMNSKEDVHYLSMHDTIYIKPKNIDNFSIGQTIQIFRNMGEVEHPVTGKDVGVKIRILGKCEIKRIHKNVVTAQIVESYDIVRRGDQVRPWKNPMKDIRPRRNKVTLQGYIVDTIYERVFLGEHQMVFLDKGISHGIEEGNRAFVIRQQDPIGNSDGFRRKELPFEKIGEMIILSAGSNTSVALVTRSLTTLRLGDRMILEKNY